MTKIEQLQRFLRKEKIASYCIDDVTDIFYLTGLTLSVGRMIVTPKEATLFVDGRYFEACSHKDILPVILTKGYGKQTPFGRFMTKKRVILCFDPSQTTVSAHLLLKQVAKIKAAPSLVKTMRQIKDKDELLGLKRAAKLAARGYDHVVSILQEGMTEKEIAAKLKIFWLEQGAEGEAFSPIIAFGANSALPHYTPGKRALKWGDLVLIDIGVILNGYHSDMTRVVFFGEPDPVLKKIYNVVRQAQSEALKLCIANSIIGKVDEAARSLIAHEGYGEFFPHSLGHGIGLETHEAPILSNAAACFKQKLVPGMVVTVEPGIYLPKVGGVRIEDTVVITEGKCESLTLRSTALKVLKQ